MSEYRTLDKNRDVVGVLKLIKELAYGDNEKKYPARQSVLLMKKLFKMCQEETETLTEYYKRFISLIESVENTYGKLVPFATVTKNEKFGPNNEVNAEKSETKRERFLAYLFMEGVQKIYKPILNDIENDYTVGHDNYPKNIEDALEILTVFGGKFNNPKKPRESEIQFMQKTEMMQKGLCFKCKRKGHKAQDCPAKEQKEKMEEQKGKRKNSRRNISFS